MVTMDPVMKLEASLARKIADIALLGAAGLVLSESLDRLA